MRQARGTSPMPATRSVEERLADLRRQQDQLRAREQALLARAAAQARKDDTRRKILLGAFLLARLDRDHGLRDLLRRELPGFLDDPRLATAARDRNRLLLADLLRADGGGGGGGGGGIVADPPAAPTPPGDDRRA